MGKKNETDPTKETSAVTRVFSILVNPEAVSNFAGIGDNGAKKVVAFAEEQRSTNKHNFLEVDVPAQVAARSDNLLHDIGIHLPPAGADFQIDVCGIKTDVSNWLFMLALRRLGYNARFNQDASCTGWTEPLPSMQRDILEEFPDFLD